RDAARGRAARGNGGQADGVEEALREAIDLHHAALATSPGNLAAARHLALALNDYSKLLTDPGRSGEAEAASREAVGLLQTVVKRGKVSYFVRPYLARAQNRLAEILEHSGRAEEAEGWRRRGLGDLRGPL